MAIRLVLAAQDGSDALRTVFMPESNIIGYPDHYVQSTERHPMDYLAAQITTLGLDGARIGVEMDILVFRRRLPSPSEAFAK